MAELLLPYNEDSFSAVSKAEGVSRKDREMGRGMWGW